jgi:ArsR family transcriptional regulator
MPDPVPPSPAHQWLALQCKALADPRRLSILDTLMDGVQCNCEIAERLGISLSLASYHLRMLSEAGLVESTPDPEDARWIYYSVRREALENLKGEICRLLDVGRIQPRQPSCGPRRGETCGPKRGGSAGQRNRMQERGRDEPGD